MIAARVVEHVAHLARAAQEHGMSELHLLCDDVAAPGAPVELRQGLPGVCRGTYETWTRGAVPVATAVRWCQQHGVDPAMLNRGRRVRA